MGNNGNGRKGNGRGRSNRTLPRVANDELGIAVVHDGRELWTLVRWPIYISFRDSDVTRVGATIMQQSPRRAVFVLEDDAADRSGIAYPPLYSNPASSILGSALTGCGLTGPGRIGHEPGSMGSRPEKRKRGTRLEILTDWKSDEVEEIVRRLRTFLPPEGKEYIVNGVAIERYHPDYIVEARLETIQRTNKHKSPRLVTGDAEIHIRRFDLHEEAFIMETGVPVMSLREIDVPFQIDVQAGVPMSPDRTSVKPAFLRDILVGVLNATAQTLSETEANAKWIDLTIVDERVTPDIIKMIKQKRVGNALIVSTCDRFANERAAGMGIELISTRGWDPIIVERMRKDAGLQTATEVFPRPNPADVIPIDETKGMQRTRAFIEALAEKVGFFIPEVRFVDHNSARGYVDCSMQNVITFYLNQLPEDLFDPEDITGERSLLEHIFEGMAHLGPSGKSPYAVHDRAWGETVAMVGAVAVLNPEIMEVLRGTP